MKRTIAKFVALLAGMVILLAACQTTPTATDDKKDEGMDQPMHRVLDFGEGAEAADADRKIDIEMLDTLKFNPDSLEIKVGETITFVVVNSDKIDHEFVIGDRAIQDEHEQQMSEGEMMEEMAAEANAMSVGPGETKELTFRFTKATSLEYGCHEPGHYAGGMIGEITVS